MVCVGASGNSIANQSGSVGMAQGRRKQFGLMRERKIDEPVTHSE